VLPANKNISIYKGDTYILTFRLRTRDQYGNPSSYVDLTGCEGKAQIRKTEADAAIVAEFEVTLANQSTEPGKVTLKLTPEQTAVAALDSGVWDVQITFPDGEVRTYLRGSVTAIKEVTRVP
jgi:hypothetical protein